MKITRCKYGHYYDKEYFRQCPHCYEGEKKKAEQRKREQEEAMLSGKIKQEKTETKKESRKKVHYNFQEEIQDIIKEKTMLEKEQDMIKEKKMSKKGQDMIKEKTIPEKGQGNKKDEKSPEEKRWKQGQNISRFVIMAGIPSKVMKNHDFCIDFCIASEEKWKHGADMLLFKNREGVRDLKIVGVNLPSCGQIKIYYKEEILYQSEEMEISNQEIGLYTFPVCVTDNRDRRFHMIKVCFEIQNQGISIPLYLQPII